MSQQLMPPVPRPRAGIDPRTLDGVKRIRVEGTTSYDIAQLGYNPGIPGQNAIGINSQATGRKINVQVHVIYKAIPYLSPQAISWIREMKDQTLVFIRKKYPQIPKVVIEANRVAMMALPQLHYHLHELALREEDAIDPAWVIRNWFVAGSLLSHPQIYGTPEGQPERLVLVQAKADTRILNLWGNNVKGGDYLWLVLKEIEVNPETRYVTDVAGLAVQKPGTRGAKGGTVNYVTRFVPVISDSAETVDTEDLVYLKNCVRHYGRKIYIGRVGFNGFWSQNTLPVVNSMDTRINNNPVLNYSNMLRCNPLEVYVCVST